MKVTMFSNFLMHHQSPFCDEMYKHLKEDFTFVSTEQMPDSFIQMGYPDCSSYVYNLNSYIDDTHFKRALKLGFDSDIVITGSAPEVFIKERIRLNKHTFRYSERLLKKGDWQLFSPHILSSLLRSHAMHRNKNLYMLCSSAYLANDLTKVFAYPKKMYKWGYFTAVSELDIQLLLSQKPSEKINMLWTGRFIKWKHPELAIQLAYELKKKGYNFNLYMIGNGDLIDSARELIKKMDLHKHITLIGNLPNSEVCQYMKNANIFLFTSDRNEGWGAVLNEAMSNGCAVVASDAIGAVPFLIDYQKNGMIYKSGSLKSILQQTEKLFANKLLREELGTNAYKILKNVWSPENAAKNFLLLAKSKLSAEKLIIDGGPCSIAEKTITASLYKGFGY